MQFSDGFILLLVAACIALTVGCVLLALGMFNRAGNHCSSCAYPLKGLPAHAPCPECGAAPAGSTGRHIPRNTTQVRIGLTLIAIALLPFAALLIMLIRAAI